MDRLPPEQRRAHRPGPRLLQQAHNQVRGEGFAGLCPPPVGPLATRSCDLTAPSWPLVVDRACSPRVSPLTFCRLIAVRSLSLTHCSFPGAIPAPCSLLSAPSCCTSGASFHYCFGPEQRLLDDVLRRPGAYRVMTEDQRRDVRSTAHSPPSRTSPATPPKKKPNPPSFQKHMAAGGFTAGVYFFYAARNDFFSQVWPSTRELGGYSYSLSRDAAALAQLWSLLLDTLAVGACPSAQHLASSEKNISEQHIGSKF